MSAARIKNLVLLILALTAAFLLAAVIPARTALVRQRREMLQTLRGLFEAQQISLELEQLPDSETLYTVELTGEPLSAVSALLQEPAEPAPDATRFEGRYTAASGSVTTGLSGAFRAELTGSEPVRDPQTHTERLLQNMQLRTGPVETVRESAGVTLCSAGQQLLGVPVFDAELQFRYEDDRLVSVTGVCFPGAAALSRVSEAACISCADALTAFLRSRNDLGWLGSRVLSVTQGYVYAEAAAATRLAPIWRIETDTDVFRVSGITAEIRRETPISSIS